MRFRITGLFLTLALLVSWLVGAVPATAVVADVHAQLVRETKTSEWSKPSTDPSDVAYRPATNQLVIVDGEIDEVLALTPPMAPYYQGANVWETALNGTVQRTWTTVPWNNEPAGVAFNPDNDHMFVTNDVVSGVTEIDKGPDGNFGTGDDVRRSWGLAGDGLIHDFEGITVDKGATSGACDNRIFLTDGHYGRVFKILPGTNCQFDGYGSDDVISFWPTTSLGLESTAVAYDAIAYDRTTDHLYLLRIKEHSDVIEATTSGALVRVIDISPATVFKPAGIALGPGSDNPLETHLYITDRGVDNQDSFLSNDGRLFEMRLVSGRAVNLVSNTSFEVDVDVAAGPDNWGSDNEGPITELSRSSTFAHSGSFAAKLTGTGASVTIEQPLAPVVAATPYRFSGWHRVPSGSYSLQFQVAWQNAAGTTLRTDRWILGGGATSGWVQTEEVLVAPATAELADVRAVLTNLNTTVYIDDVLLGAAASSPPVPGDDLATTVENTAVTIDVLANDLDGDGDPLSVVSVTDPPGGTTVKNPNNTITYTPNNGFSGSDTFDYVVTDGHGNNAIGSVTVTVNTPNGITRVSSSSAGMKNTLSLTISKPLGTGAGDIMLAAVAANNAPVTISPPAGWTLLRTDSPGMIRQTIFSRSVPAGETDSSYTFTISGTTLQHMAGAIVTYRGAAGVDVVSGQPNATSTTSITAPTVDPTVTNTRLVGFFGMADFATNMITPPSGMSEIVEQSAGSNGKPVLEVADQPLSSGSPTGTRVATSTLANRSVGQLVVLAPGTNNPPTAANDGYTANAGTPLAVAAAGVLSNDTDPDVGNTLIVASHTDPIGGTLAINANGSFTYTPDSGFAGVDTFDYTVSDTRGGTDSATVTITVEGAPVTEDDVYAGDEARTLTVSAPGVLDNDTDPNGDTLTVTGNTQPGNGTATVASNGSFTYTPVAGFIGDDTFTYTVSDGQGGIATGNVTITVNPTSFVASSAATIASGTSLTIAKPTGIVAGDLMLAGITVAANTPAITAPPGWSPVITTDRGSALRQVVFSKLAASEPPNYTFSISPSTSNGAAGVIVAYRRMGSFDIPAGLGNGSSTSILAPSVTTTVGGARLVGFFGLNGAGTITPAPGMGERAEVSAGTLVPTLEVADQNLGAAGATGSRTATANTAKQNIGQLVALRPNPNDAPIISNPGAPSNAQGDVVSLPVMGSDPNGDTLSWSATGLPTGLSMNSISGIISGTVSGTAAGGSPYNVSVTAIDGRGGSDTEAFTWTIFVNSPPVVTNPGNRSSAEGDSIDLPVIATDANPGDTQTWTQTGLPTGLSINTSTGVITGTVAAGTAGPHTVTVTATDNHGASDSETFSWTIFVNSPPVVTQPANQSSLEGATVNLTVEATDADVGDTRTWSQTLLPPGLTLNPSTGVISGAIAAGASSGSPYSTTVTATDSHGATNSKTFTWTVIVNRAPVLSAPADRTDAEGDPVSLPVGGSDPDVADTLAWTATDLPAGLSINPTSGVISGTIDAGAAATGPYEVTVTATDDHGADDTVGFTWTVFVNGAPVVTSPGNQTTAIGSSVNLTLAAADPDAGDTRTWSQTGLPAGLTLTASTGVITGSIEAGEEGDHSVTVTATDNHGADDTVAFTWTAFLNGAPDAVADSYTTLRDVALVVAAPGVLDNDSDPQGHTLTVTGNTTPAHGSASVAANGSFTYTPDPGYAGPDSFDYTVADGHGGTDTATVTVLVNRAPVLIAPADRTDAEGDPVSLPVGGSDPDVADTLAWTATDLPAGLSINPTSGVISGTIDAGAAATGPYEVTVTATDDHGADDTVGFTWTVFVNGAPVVTSPGNQTTAIGSSVNLTLAAADPDAGDTRTWSQTGLPAGLTLTASTGVITGSIEAGEEGDHSVTVTATDNHGADDTVAFTWTAFLNGAPDAVADSYTTLRDVALVVAAPGVLDNDSDPQGHTLTVTGNTTPAHGSASVAANGSFTYTPDPGYAGPDSFDYTVADGHGGTDTATVTVLVNRAPVLIAPADRTDAEGDPVSLPVGGSDPDVADTLAWTATDLPAGLSINPTSGVISGTIDAGAAATGPYEVTVTATDDHGADDTVGFTWTVFVNGAPVVTSPGNQTTAIGSSVNLTLAAADPDAGDTRTWSQTGLPAGLTLTASTGVITGSIEAGEEGDHSVTVTATDNHGADDTVAFTWTAFLNGAPDAVADSYTTLRDVALVVAAPGVLDNDSDPQGHTLTVTGNTTPAHGSASVAANGSFTYTPDPGYAGPDSFDYTVADGHGGTDTATVTVLVNRAPVLIAPADRTDAEGDPVSLPVGGSDPDVADTLAWTATDLPAGLSINPTSGVISGTIDAGAAATGPYEVTVTATDDHGADDTVGFTWTVFVNGAPVVTSPGNQTTAIGSSVNLTLAAADPDAGDTRTWSQTGLPAGLTLTASTGVITGSIEAGEEGDHSVTVTATDNHGADDTVAFTWTAFLNGAPDAVADSYTTLRDVALVVAAPGVLDNDSDPQGHTLTVTGNTTPAHGSASVAANGSFTYTPDPGYAGPDSFDYTVADGHGGTDTATVTVLVNRAPVLIAPADRTDAEGDPVSLPVGGSDPDVADTLAWTATDLPAGLSINPTSGVISGTIDAGAAATGPYEVTVTATDDHGADDTVGFTWTVFVNGAPVVTPPGDQTSAEGASVTLPVVGSDPNAGVGDTLTWSATDLPAGLSIDEISGVITGSIEAGAAATGPYEVTVTATDDHGLFDAETFTWTVFVNGAPVVTTPAAQTSAEGASVNLPVVGSDPNAGEGDTLTWTVGGLPTGLSINGSSGVISGTIATGAHTGSPYTVTVTATDSRGASDEATFGWTVTGPPGITRVGMTSVGLKNTTALTITKPTGTTSGDLLLAVISANNAPAINTPSGWTLVVSTASSTSIRQAVFRRVATGGEPANYTFTVATPQHLAGVVVAYRGASGVDASSGVGNASTTAMTAPSVNANVPNSLLVGAYGLATVATIASAPGMTQVAEISAQGARPVLEVADQALTAAGATGNRVATAASAARNIGQLIILRPAGAPLPNNPPVVTRPADQNTSEGGSVSLAVVGNDPDAGDTLTWTAGGLPAGLSINGTTGAITGTIATGAHTGSPYTVTVTATDNHTASDAETFTWTVGTVNTITRVGMTSVGLKNTTALTITKPTGTTSGDLLLAVISANNAPAINTPSGWTLVVSTASSTSIRQAVFRRVATGGEPANYTFTVATPQHLAGVVVAYRGASGVDASSGVGNASTTAMTAPSVNANVPNSLLVGAYGLATVATIASAPGMTQVAEISAQGARPVLEVADQALTAAGATGNRVATAASAARNIGQLIILRPAGAGAVNQGPVAIDDVYAANAGSQLVIDPSAGVLVNDQDPDGAPSPLTVTSSTDPAGGSVSVAPDGSFTYTPDPGFTGTDTFEYTVTDGEGSDTGSVAITVSAPGSITRVGYTTAGVKNTTSLTIDRPTGTADGDLLLAVISANNGATIETPPEWTLVDSTASGGAIRQAIFSRISTGADPASFTFTVGALVHVSGVIVTYRGASAVDAVAGLGNDTNTAITAPSLTASASDSLLVGAFGIATVATIDPAPGMAEIVEVSAAGARPILTVADEPLTAAGSTGPRIATASIAARSVGQLVVLRP